MSAFDQALDTVRTVAGEITGKVREVSHQVAAAAEPAWEKTKDLAGNVGEQVTAAATPAWEKVTDVAGTVTSRVTDLAGDVKESVFGRTGDAPADAPAAAHPGAPGQDDAHAGQTRAAAEATESESAQPLDTDTDKT